MRTRSLISIKVSNTYFPNVNAKNRATKASEILMFVSFQKMINYAFEGLAP